MGVRAAFVVCVATATTVIVACSSFDGADTPSTDGGVESSSDLPEASGPSEVDAGPPDLFDDGFESDASAPCKDWVMHGMNPVESDMPHAGNRACRVCIVDLNDPFAYRDVPIPDSTRTYFFSVQMRLSSEGFPDAAAPDDAGEPKLLATLGLYRDTTMPLGFLPASIPSTTSWAPVVVSVSGGPEKVEGAYARLSVYTTPAWASRCFEIDDVRLYSP